MRQKEPQDVTPTPLTTMELLDEYYQILELSGHRSFLPTASDGYRATTTELKQRLEDAYERETVHGGLVHAGRLAKEVGQKAPTRQDFSDGGKNNCGVWPVKRQSEGKLPAAGDLCAEEPGTDVPQLVETKPLAELSQELESHGQWAMTDSARMLLRNILLHIRNQDVRLQRLERIVRRMGSLIQKYDTV